MGGGGRGGGFILFTIYHYIHGVCEVKWHTSNHPSASLQKRKNGVERFFQVMNEWMEYLLLTMNHPGACMHAKKKKKKKNGGRIFN